MRVRGRVRACARVRMCVQAVAPPVAVAIGALGTAVAITAGDPRPLAAAPLRRAAGAPSCAEIGDLPSLVAVGVAVARLACSASLSMRRPPA